MNSTVGLTNNTTTAILCPYDNRRSSKELWVKLFVVHLTTIAAFCHVLSVRREPILRWKLIFYVLVPYTIFAYHALALLAFFGGLVYYQIRPSEALKDSLWRTPIYFFGLAPQEGEQSYELLPSTARPGDVVPAAPEKESGFKKIGRFLLASTFVVQCIGTTILYSRRQQHHAVTFADQRVFELGCTGILTGLYWLAHTLELPPFSLSAPTLHQDAKTTYDKLILETRDCQTPSMTTADDVPGLLSCLKNGAIAFILLLIEGKLKLFQFTFALLHDIFTGSDTVSSDDQTAEFMIFIIGVSFGGLASLFACCGTPRSKTSMRLGRKRKKEDEKPWWWICLCPCGMVLLWFPTIVSIGGLSVFMFFCMQWSSISGQMAALDAWPTNTTCPLLWSDGAANWIWAIA